MKTTHYTVCYLCLKELPFVDVRPQLCGECMRATSPHLQSSEDRAGEGWNGDPGRGAK